MYGKLKDQPFIWYEKIEKKNHASMNSVHLS